MHYDLSLRVSALFILLCPSHQLFVPGVLDCLIFPKYNSSFLLSIAEPSFLLPRTKAD